MELFGSDKKKVLWGVVYDHVVEEVNDYDELGLQGFGLNFVGKYEEGVGREGLSEYPYILMLMKL